MAWPESELGREEIRSAILAAKTPDEFFDKHLSSFRDGWMQKAFWTIKNHPEFRWDSGRSYVELPHITSIKDLIEHIEIKKNRPSEKYHLWAKPDLYGETSHKGQYRALWTKPKDITIETYEKIMGNYRSSELGLGGFRLIKWPQKEGYAQKYLFLCSTVRVIGDVWLALLTDIDVPIIDAKENTEKKQA